MERLKNIKNGWKNNNINEEDIDWMIDRIEDLENQNKDLRDNQIVED